MSLHLLHKSGVTAEWLVRRLAEEVDQLVFIAGIDTDRQEIEIDSAEYDVQNGLVVGIGGRRFRLRVEAEELM